MNINEMFHTRYQLHYKAYQHKTSNIIEQMFLEALVVAEMEHKIQLPGKDGIERTLAESVY
jgi:HD superfamily phosphohydrolase